MKKKRVATIVVILLILVILQGCSSNHDGNKFDAIEYLEQKSIAISLATYTGSESFLLENSKPELKEILLDLAEKNSNKDVIVEHIKINTTYKEGESITVITMIEEKPFKSILFHNLTYEYINGKWLLVTLEEDA